MEPETCAYCGEEFYPDEEESPVEPDDAICPECLADLAG